MTITCVATPAAMKLLVEEPGSVAAASFFAADEDREFVSSWLLHTELHCAVGRRGGEPRDLLAEVLKRISLTDVTRGDFVAAGFSAPLRAADAIHLAVARRLGADELVTYDRELADAASAVGIQVVSPVA